MSSPNLNLRLPLWHGRGRLVDHQLGSHQQAPVDLLLELLKAQEMLPAEHPQANKSRMLTVLGPSLKSLNQRIIIRRKTKRVSPVPRSEDRVPGRRPAPLPQRVESEEKVCWLTDVLEQNCRFPISCISNVLSFPTADSDDDSEEDDHEEEYTATKRRKPARSPRRKGSQPAPWREIDKMHITKVTEYIVTFLVSVVLCV